MYQQLIHYSNFGSLIHLLNKILILCGRKPTLVCLAMIGLIQRRKCLKRWSCVVESCPLITLFRILFISYDPKSVGLLIGPQSCSVF